MRWSALVILLAAVGLTAAGCGGAHMRSFRVPSSAMEPTLHCAEPAIGCLGAKDDHTVVQVGKPVKRGDIVVFRLPRNPGIGCGEHTTFISRIVGLPGETVSENYNGFLFADGKRLIEPYIDASMREEDENHYRMQWKVPTGDYLVVIDNRGGGCDARDWGAVPRRDIIGPVVKIIRG